MNLPESIRVYTDGHTLTPLTDGRSGDSVYAVGDDYILKISPKIDRVRRECAANDWLSAHLPVSRSVACVVSDGLGYYLKTPVCGIPLFEECFLQDPKRLAGLLAKAMRLFHSVDAHDCPLRNADSEGDCLIHGDFCLPNILVNGDEIAGFIDTEAAGVGDPWMDYAWCIWSFEYNLGTKEHTHLLLEALGIEFDRERYDRYIAR